MTTRSNAAKVPNAEGIIADINIGRFLNNEQNRNLSQVSKAFNQAFFNNLKFNLKCADAQELQKELQGMRKEPEPCKNTAKVIFNPEKGMQRAIMCAIMSVDQKLHVYVETEHLKPFLDSQTVKCFDKNYKLKLTLLYPRDPQAQAPLQPGELRCAGGFHALKGGWARNGSLQDQEGVQVVRFTGNTHVVAGAFFGIESLMELLDVSSLTEIGFNAFKDTQLTQLGDMPKLTLIGGFAFEHTPLEQLGNMPKLEIIGEYAFAGTPLKQLGNLDSLTRICDAAFAGTQLKNLGKTEKLGFIGEGAFRDSHLTQLGDLPELTFIGAFAFTDTPLAQLGKMEKLTTIGEGAFAHCRDLSVVRLPKTLEEVRENAFLGLAGEITVEPGADFVCKCVHLAEKLRELSKKNKNIHIRTIKRGKIGIYQIISR